MEMDIFKIEKKELKLFLDKLNKKYSVYTPVESDGITYFAEVTAIHKLPLPDFCNTDRAPKEIFFPQSETMLKYEGENVKSVTYKGKPIAVFGVRPCDAKSFMLLDKVFDNDKHTDTYWKERYKDTLVFTVACNNPLTTCFCNWVAGGPFDKEGADIFFVDIGNGFVVEPCNEKGVGVIHELPIQKVTDEDLRLAEEQKKKAELILTKQVEIGSLKDTLDKNWDLSLWEEVAYRCLGCAICTYLCPTCHCFDIQDECKSGKGERIRIWDSCMFKLFTQEAAGTNPRPTTKERIRQRVMHKFNYFIENIGNFGCVGCGRCIINCPVNIDIREIIKSLKV